MNLVWLDIETTDADHAKGGIIEIAAVVADEERLPHTLEILVQPRPEETWDPFCVEMHDKNGLYDLIVEQKLGVSYEEADFRLAMFLWKIFGTIDDKKLKPRAAGFSVQFDTSFLKAKGFTQTMAILSHRIVDVSTLRDVGTEKAGWSYEKKAETHRALPDCFEALDCYKAFCQAYMHPNPTPWAYSQACRALEQHHDKIRELDAENQKLGAALHAEILANHQKDPT